MNLRSFVVMGLGFVGLGGAFSYGASGCSPKNIINDDSGTPVCKETGTGAAGEGCPCDPAKYKPKACYDGPTGSLGAGRACKSGTRKCNENGTLSACDGQIVPSAEVCNTLDDDCDGIVDNVTSEDPIITDLTDGGFDPPLEGGVQCYVNGQTGLCAAGRYGCNTQNMKDCVAIVKADPDGGLSPYTEICNGWDDDCDGTKDNVDWVGQMCMVTYEDGGSPKGECGKGTHQCNNGVESCDGPKPTADNTCNGKDDNCNGQYDETTCPCSCAKGQYCCVSSQGQLLGGCYGSAINGYTCYPHP